MELREGCHRDEDTIGQVWFGKRNNMNISTLGSLRGQTLSEPLEKTKFESLKDRFYAFRGRDLKAGYPTNAKLEELEISDVAHKLKSAGKLGWIDIFKITDSLLYLFHFLVHENGNGTGE